MKLLWARFLIWWRQEEEQCSCDRPSPLVLYDANGWKQWCGDCLGLRV